MSHIAEVLLAVSIVGAVFVVAAIVVAIFWNEWKAVRREEVARLEAERDRWRQQCLEEDARANRIEKGEQHDA